jgi:hypothetical protein
MVRRLVKTGNSQIKFEIVDKRYHFWVGEKPPKKKISLLKSPKASRLLRTHMILRVALCACEGFRYFLVPRIIVCSDSGIKDISKNKKYPA